MKTCQRCGAKVQQTVTIVNTGSPKETAQICAACVKVAIRPKTVWQVKK